MHLLGAREFIKMPAGTFYIPYWENTKSECLQIVEKFKTDPEGLFGAKQSKLHVFGDNAGSMEFYGDKEDDYIFYYDANVVGDANPSMTLYLIIDEDELPDIIFIYDYKGNVVQITKEYAIEIRNKFVNEVCKNPKIDLWALKILDKLAKEPESIVNINY